MGFGLIFIGYITLLFMKVMPPAMAAGAYGMFRGLDKLSIYGKKFKRAATWAAVLGIYYLIYTVLWIVSSLGVAEGLFSGRIFTVCDNIVYYAILLVFHMEMYGAFEDISRYCGYEKGVKKAYMSRFLMMLFFLFAIVNLGFVAFANPNNYMLMAEYICQFSWILYTAGYIYGCYMRIATDEIIEEEEKKIAEYDAKYGFKREKKKK